MSLLDEIVDLSVKDEVKVSALLRKCLVLAAKIKNDKLKEWAQHELKGYPYPDPNSERLPESFPEYRVLDIQARGNFQGPMGALISDVVLAPASMPDAFKWWAAKCYFAEPIAVFKAATGALKVGTDVATKVMSEALLKFYGVV
jgi:AbiTii